jgi:hypothetical protein
MTEPDPQAERVSRYGRWVGWIPLLALCVVPLAGYRIWTDRLKQSPVAEVHARFLDFMAGRSPRAQAYRIDYYSKFERDSVASEHFEQVCAAMYSLAVEDKLDPADYSTMMAKGCKAFGRRYPGTELPQ